MSALCTSTLIFYLARVSWVFGFKALFTSPKCVFYEEVH